MSFLTDRWAKFEKEFEGRMSDTGLAALKAAFYYGVSSASVNTDGVAQLVQDLNAYTKEVTARDNAFQAFIEKPLSGRTK